MNREEAIYEIERMFEHGGNALRALGLLENEIEARLIARIRPISDDDERRQNQESREALDRGR